MDIERVFGQIYQDNAWSHGSGEGSLIAHTEGYVRFLERFMRSHPITSVVDVGCGDWQFSQFVDWTGISYVGYDVVASIVAGNRRRFASDTVAFVHYPGDPRALPSADLLICKDVLQHLPDAAIAAFMAELPRYRYALITNDVNPRGATPHRDTHLGGYRPLDLCAAPYHLAARSVFTFRRRQFFLRRWLWPRWEKQVLLWDREAEATLSR